MTELSSATLAIKNAANQAYWDWGNMCPSSAENIAAAAFRAAAIQLREAYANEEYVEPADDWLETIARELEDSK